MMKILAMTSNFRVSGQGIAAHQISENLAKRGHDVRLQVFDSTQELKRFFKGASYKVDYRPSVPLMPSTGLHVLKQVLYLLKLQRTRQFDVALGLDTGDGAALGTAFAKEAGLTSACIGWGNEFQGLGRTELGFLKNSDILFPVSRWAKNMFVDAGFDEERMKILPPGVDLDIFRPLKTRAKGLNLITVGELSKGSGVDQLILVLRILLDKGLDATLTVVGKGPEMRALKAQVRDMFLEGNVSFKGRLAQRKVADLMRKHHVFALLKRKIRGQPMPDFSIGMIEAAASGLGVVGTKVGGLSDSLRFSGGTRVPAENPDKVASAIIGVARKVSLIGEDPELFGRMRSWEEVALELEGYLEEGVYE